MYPNAYIEYLVHFHGDRDYFECHEILEEHWKTDPIHERKMYWVGLIQIAVSVYHYRRQNFNGAIRMIKSASFIISKEDNAISKLGLDYKKLVGLLHEQLQRMESKHPYQSINFPIIDPELEQLCILRCTEKRLHWKSKSDLSNSFLLNKHMLRDRTSVIAERLQQIAKRKQR